MSSIASTISRYFELEKFGTTIRTEIIAGISTYLSLAYIFIVNPAILSQAGIEPQSALFATAVAASLATLAMGLWANLPFAVAPGLTMNSYFVFVVCQKMGFSWQQGLATVFISGVLCVILTALPLRQAIIDSLPLGLKRAITVTIGVFVATIGLFLAKIVTFTSSGMINFAELDSSHLTSPLVAVLLAGLFISLVLGLRRLHFPAGMLIAIIASAMLYHQLIPPTAASTTDGGHIFSSVGQLDFSIFFQAHFWLPVIVFFVLDFFEGIGGFIGMTTNTTIQDKDGNVPHIKQGLWVDGLGTVGGSVLGTSSLIIFVESAVGIKAGGRTGLTAVTCSVLMVLGVLASFYFMPVLALIPAQAAAGVLVYVGYLILSSSVASRKESGLSSFDMAVALVMGLIAFATFSLDKSLAFGFLAYFAQSVIARKPAWWLAAIAGALTTAIVCSA
ncbi:MAG: NCS2 family permease [Rickettsiales bacterium]|nr:NCS2 family permease [Rickettsiales bacterium]